MKIGDTVKIIGIDNPDDRLPCIVVSDDAGHTHVIEYMRITEVHPESPAEIIHENGIPQ